MDAKTGTMLLFFLSSFMWGCNVANKFLEWPVTFSSECSKGGHELGVRPPMMVQGQISGQFSNTDNLKFRSWTNQNVLLFCCKSGIFGFKNGNLIMLYWLSC